MALSKSRRGDMILIVGLFLIMSFSARAEERDVLAKVGNRIITRSEFDQLLKKKGEPKDKQTEIGLVTNMVQTIALGDAARKKGIDKRQDIKISIELTIDSLLANELIKEEVLDKITVTEEEARKYFEAHRDQFKVPERARFRQILIKSDKSASDETKRKAKERAEEVLRKLKTGEDFSKLAMEYSDDPSSKAKGGDLGFIEKGRTIKVFDEAAFKLNPGEYSGIVETAYGFHLIKMEDRIKGTPQPFESVKEKVMTQARDEIKTERLKEYLAKVMKEADITIFSGVLEGKKK